MELEKALKYLVTLGEDNSPLKTYTFGDRTYADKTPIAMSEPVAPTVKVFTLTGLSDLVDAGLEGLEDNDDSPDKCAPIFAHVVSEKRVELLAKEADKWGRRQLFAFAELMETAGFKFNVFHDHNEFIIGVLSNFTEDGDRDYVVRIASSLTNTLVTTSDDDGITQNVGVKQSASLKANEALKSRVQLAPYRTFREVKQPVSDFVFRVMQSGDNVPKLALFEADGGKWRIDAIEEIDKALSRMMNLDIVS